MSRDLTRDLTSALDTMCRVVDQLRAENDELRAENAELRDERLTAEREDRAFARELADERDASPDSKVIW